MKKLALNKETLVRLNGEGLVLVRGAMRPVGDTGDCVDYSAAHQCYTNDPCDTINTCNLCPVTGCKGGMSSKPI